MDDDNDNVDATSEDIEHHLVAAALSALFWYPDRPDKAGIILPELPEVQDDDPRLTELQAAFSKFAQSDATTLFYALGEWGREKGWPWADLMALMRSIARVERRASVQRWVKEIGGSSRFKWPGHPIARSSDGQLLPRGLVSIPRDLIFDARLSDTAVRLYGILLSYADPGADGVWRATVPVPRLCRHLNLTEPAFRPHMKQLKEHGYVKDVGQQHGGSNPNTYELEVKA